MSYTTVKSLATTQQRRQYAQDIIKVAQGHGWSVEENRERDSERTLILAGFGLKAMIHLDRSRSDLEDAGPMIHWHGAERDIMPAHRAWQSVNRFHKRKATSFSDSLEETIERLAQGMDLAQTGKAWVPELEDCR